MKQSQLNWITRYIWGIADYILRDLYVSFTRYFYKPQPMHTLEDITADILALECVLKPRGCWKM